MAKRVINTDALMEHGEPKHKINENSLKNLQPRKKGVREKKYMQLDIIEFEDYLNLMCKNQGVTRTKYILALIRKDFEEHRQEYELLQQLQQLQEETLSNLK